MAYQKRNKGPRYITTGSIVNPQNPTSVRQAAYAYKKYLQKLMTALQNRARQEVFKLKLYKGSCVVCGENDTTKFYVDYGSPPQTIDLCHKHHKEYSQCRGTIYDQLCRHGVSPLSWDEWKSGMRPAPKESNSIPG